MGYSSIMRISILLLCCFAVILIDTVNAIAPILKTIQASRRDPKFRSTRTEPIRGSTPTNVNNDFGALRERVRLDNLNRERNSQRYEENPRKEISNNKPKTVVPGKSLRSTGTRYVDDVKINTFKKKNFKTPTLPGSKPAVKKTSAPIKPVNVKPVFTSARVVSKPARVQTTPSGKRRNNIRRIV